MPQNTFINLAVEKSCVSIGVKFLFGLHLTYLFIVSQNKFWIIVIDFIR